ncbi:QRFP-like peptide receptor [Watersipora subatra]|uniref:QRFP-like peptide receptor n=1 Tax=Watersipora subatra TaxID=2589382 RepID=UPI00355BCA88
MDEAATKYEMMYTKFEDEKKYDVPPLPSARNFHFQVEMFTADWQCRLYLQIAITAFHASPLSSAALAIERLIIVCYPLKAKFYRRPHKLLIIIIIWIVAYGSEIINTLNKKLIVSSEGIRYCVNTLNATPCQRFWISSSKYMVSFIAITLCYSVIAYKIMRRRTSKAFKNSSHQKTDSSTRLLMMLAIDAFLTLCTWLPYNIMITSGSKILSKLGTERWARQTLLALQCLLLTNSFSSPVVYFIFNPNFRADVKSLVLKCRKGKDVNKLHTVQSSTSVYTIPSNSAKHVQCHH